MSSTNRGSDRHPADYYPTPSWCVDRLLEAVDMPGGVWLEACAGEGHIIRAAQRDDVAWAAVELREECSQVLADAGAQWVVIGDINSGATFALADEAQPDVIITNPPFGISAEVIQTLLHLAERNRATLVILQRLNYLGTASRSWLDQQMPDIYVLPDRPSFTGKGTDSCEYAWFVWPAGEYHRSAGRVQRLAVTPSAQKLAPETGSEPLKPRQRALFGVGA